MTEPIELRAAAEGMAEIIAQEGVSVDVDTLASRLEEWGPEVADDLLSATDPGGLVDTLDDMDPDLLDW